MPTIIASSARATVILCAVLAVLPGVGWAQHGDDWSRTMSRPVRHMEFNGSLVELRGRHCYIGGPTFYLLELSDIDAPVVLGSTVLPAEPLDMLVLDDAVYMACGDSGVVRIDTRPSSDFTAHPVDTPGDVILSLTRLGNRIVAGDDESRLYFIAPETNASLANPACRLGPTRPDQMLSHGNLLIVVGPEGAYVIDGLLTGAVAVTDSVPRDSDDFDLRAAGLEDGTLHIFVRRRGYDEARVVTRYEICDEGRLEEISRQFWTMHDEYAGEYGWGDLRLSGGYYVVSNYYRMSILDTDSFLAVEIEPIGIQAVGELDGDRMVALTAAGGLFVWSLADPPFPLPLSKHGSHGRGQRKNRDEWRLVVWKDDLSMYPESDNWVARFEMIDLRDPLLPDLLATGSASGCSPDECIPDIELMAIGTDWFAVYRSGIWFPFIGHAFYDLASGELIDEYLGTYWGDFLFVDEEVWRVSDDGNLERFRVDLAQGLLPIAVHEAGLGNWVQILSPGPGLLVTRYGHEYTSYEVPDVGPLIERGQISFANYQAPRAWYGRFLLVRDSWQIRSISFADPAAPKDCGTITVPWSAGRVQVSDNRLVIYPVGRNGTQFAEIASDGTLTPGQYIDSPAIENVAWDGEYAYCATEYGTHLYRFAGIGHAEWIGQRGPSFGDVSIIDGYLVTGRFVYPLHDDGSLGIDGRDDVIPEPVTGHGIEDVRLAPNPFNPRVMISFKSDRRQQVEVRVHDIRGHLVRELYKGEALKGTWSGDWDGTDGNGRDMPSGIYLVRVSSERQVVVGKAVLIR